ncbi:FAD-dependent oxidoreductase [Candidatus Woesebacteria bacterium]|nr:FAD-dependent oxidoreductase [Candidatus Woesebacteria bacterium]
MAVSGAYGVLVGAIFGSQLGWWRLYASPELALIMGNIFSFAVSPKYRLLLRLVEKRQLARQTFEFVFQSSRKMRFQPGQYMEWTFAHDAPDDRGNRRYFTIASSPTEEEILLGVRIPEQASSYKRELAAMQPGEEIVAGQLAGDFTLPADETQPLVFIAGGIGITPFRSMIQYLVDTKQKRAVTLFYVNKIVDDIAYKDLFDAAKKKLPGFSVVYVLTDESQVPKKWSGETGYITGEMLQRHLEDITRPLYYLSGPNAMVDAYKDVLRVNGVNEAAIKTDYFPGF